MGAFAVIAIMAVVYLLVLRRESGPQGYLQAYEKRVQEMGKLNTADKQAAGIPVYPFMSEG